MLTPELAVEYEKLRSAKEAAHCRWDEAIQASAAYIGREAVRRANALAAWLHMQHMNGQITEAEMQEMNRA